MKTTEIISEGWSDYELIDTGDGRKLERFGDMILDRPDPEALWAKSNQNIWLDANAQFVWADKGERWRISKGSLEEWQISCDSMRLGLSLKGFKHVGIFPEHYVQWQKIINICKSGKYRVLNLFGYTGAATMAAAGAGAEVTHVDASKQSIATLKNNMEISNIKDAPVRTVCEDALRYARRLIDRKEQFEIIIMDPPAFGRGPKGEVWKIEEKLPELISLVPKLMSDNAKLVILNGYSSGFSSRTFGYLLKEALKEKNGSIEHGEIGIKQINSDRVLTTGIYSSWEPNQ